jgi:hypothetical protein
VNRIGFPSNAPYRSRRADFVEYTFAVTDFADHFSSQASGYAAHRPTYPEELFDYLAGLAPDRQRAWDCATGNGQVAVALAEHFEVVVATEPSAKQLANRERHPRVSYVRCPAAPAPLATASADLITVGQALHWFARDDFYRGATRVARPGAALAAWGYGFNRFEESGDTLRRITTAFYRGPIGPDWPAERGHLDDGYVNLPFPTDIEIPAPTFALERDWTVDEYLGYVGTWSAVARHRIRTGCDPMPAFRETLVPLWGNRRRTVTWPFYLRVARFPGG